MPPNQRRSISAVSIARMSSAGVTRAAAMPKRALISAGGSVDFALRPAARRVRLRVDEDVAVVEGADEADVARQQHAVAEHVARHVADADHGEVLLLDVATQLAEVALHGLPGAA